MTWLEVGSSEELLALVRAADDRDEESEVFYHDTYGDVVDHAYINGTEVLNVGAKDEATDAYWAEDMDRLARSYANE
jgi:hypothetical protein